MNLVQLTKEYVEGIGTVEQIAQHFGKKPSAVKMWLKLKRFPAEVTQEAFDVLTRPEEGDSPEIEEEQLLQEPEETDTAYESAIVGGEQFTEPALTPTGESQLASVLQSISDRLSLLESNLSQVAASRIDDRIPRASMTRPGGRSPVVGMPKSGEGAGSLNGRAPTREQAHWSSMGQRGKPAGPAEPRVRKPGSPGNYGWNLSKAELALRQEAARAKALQARIK
jgi:transposase-like protein